MTNSRSSSIARLSPVWRGLILGLLVPAILLGDGFASGLVLLHAHGPEGRHEHVLPASVSRGDIELLQVWHEGQHGVVAHSRSEHIAHERVSHEGLRAEVPGSGGEGEIVAQHHEIPGHVPHGSVVKMTPSPCSRPEFQARSLVQDLPRVDELPALLVSAQFPVDEAARPPGERDGHPVLNGRSKGALRVLCLSGGLLI